MKYGFFLQSFDVVIAGGGMVGLSLANQLLERGFTGRIAIIEKESKLGCHSSGRNSGILHAGIYYPPKTLKADVCIGGSRRLKRWVKDRNLPIKECGKLIVPQELKLDKQLDVLYERGIENGAKVEIWDQRQLNKVCPQARSASGRCLWSPETSIVKPILILQQLEKELKQKGVKFFFNAIWEVNKEQDKIRLLKDENLSFGYFINCAGLYADRIAQMFNLGTEYTLIPFKGLYWELIQPNKFNISTNIYPVPDLNLPFLGVHFTPDAINNERVYIGPTATIAWGRENYRSLQNLDPTLSIKNIKIILGQYLHNRDNFREYVHSQSLQMIPQLLINSARKIVPSLGLKDIKLSEKVGIRPQLFNTRTMRLENDFICIQEKNSLQVLNAISPAFSASFALGDKLVDKTKLL